jgi:hypothetical protein
VAGRAVRTDLVGSRGAFALLDEEVVAGA